MMQLRYLVLTLCALSTPVFAAKKAGGPKKVEVPKPFYWAIPDPVRGDWAGEPGFVAQIIRTDDRILTGEKNLADPADVGGYEAHIFHQFDVAHDKPVAVLTGRKTGGEITLAGGGWKGTLADGHFIAKSKSGESFDLHHVNRTPPTLGAKAPADGIVLFDGTNLKEWARRDDKDWLKPAGAPTWHLIGDGAMEIVPNSGYLLTKRTFKAYKLHLEFRTVGGSTNSGVYLQSRYEANINEVYGSLTANPCAQFDNCTEPEANPGIRCSRPPLEWQTMDIEFHPAKVGAEGEVKTSAWATVYFNGVLYYNRQNIGPLKLNAAKLGEAASGPIMIQDHSMPCDFRNIWLIELPE
jgi:hypothetical protein